MENPSEISRRKFLLGASAIASGLVLDSALASSVGNDASSKEPLLRSSVVIRVKELGAVGDGNADDTAAFQAAIDKVAPTGGEILVDPGSYKITKTLRLINPKNARAPGIWIVGAGYVTTRILSYVQEGPLLQVRGVPVSGPVSTTFFWGGGIEGIDFSGEKGGAKDHDALDILGWYYARIRNCRITKFSRHGIYSRVDLNTNSNPDFTSSIVTVEDSAFEYLGGKGYCGAFIGNPAWRWTRCGFSFCAQGAALVTSAGHTFDTCSFQGSGYLDDKRVAPGAQAHLTIGQLHGSIARIEVFNCEFDFAKSAHLYINSLAVGHIHDNRFIFRSWGTEETVPKESIILANDGAEAATKNITFERNVFRVGATGDLTLFRWANTANVQDITITGNLVSDQTGGKAKIHKYVGYDRADFNKRQNFIIQDGTDGWVSKGKWDALPNSGKE